MSGSVGTLENALAPCADKESGWSFWIDRNRSGAILSKSDNVRAAVKRRRSIHFDYSSVILQLRL
jgi:hypothetical protein